MPGVGERREATCHGRHGDRRSGWLRRSQRQVPSGENSWAGAGWGALLPAAHGGRQCGCFTPGAPFPDRDLEIKAEAQHIEITPCAVASAPQSADHAAP